MKKTILLLILLIATSVVAKGQQLVMKVLKADGSITEFKVNDVTKVYFEESSGDDDNPASIKRLKAVYDINEDGEKDYDYANPVWKDGRLVSVETYGDKMSIEYSDNSAAIKLSEDGTARTIFLNDQGYATDAFGMEISYNDAGQMTKWQGNYDGCEITYNSDGDVIRTKGINYDVDNTFVYTNSTITTKIENKGGIMLWGKWDMNICPYP